MIRRCRWVGYLLLGVLFLDLACRWSISASPAQAQTDPLPVLQAPEACPELVVLANPKDAYYPLALEIAGAEGAPLAQDIAQALACPAAFLLWVASPQGLSEAAFVELGLAMREQPGAISTGILTASTLDGARQLWRRGQPSVGETFAAANAANPAAHIAEGRIITFHAGREDILPLTKGNFLAALQESDYVTFTGHGGRNYLSLSKGNSLTPLDIPRLAGVLLGTGSCQTLRPWEGDSIARRIIDQGAAAYAGFLFSPNEGYLLGEFDELPFRYTWPEYPVGHVVQAQNRGALQGFASFPQLFLLGDPRLALQSQAPYAVVTDIEEDGERTLQLRDAPAGVLPIRIEDGAKYRFIRIPGLTAAAQGDPFYNSRLQMVNIQGDQYLLVVHPGGDLTVELRERPPWYWVLQDVLLDSLDSVLVFSMQSGGERVALLFALPCLGWVGWMLFKGRLDRKKARRAILTGIGAVILHGLYITLRLDQVTMTSKALVFNPLSLLATFLLVTCGALIYFHSRGWAGKVIAIAVVSFHFWSPALTGLAILALANLLALNSGPGVALYNYSLALLPGASLPVIVLLSSLVLYRLNR